ncbi:MAG: hypothetical protein FWH26_02875 [Oscillospiraceae bacterium]|nr:hypothetical protein [Oscillospiraceae bacterium]
MYIHTPKAVHKILSLAGLAALFLLLLLPPGWLSAPVKRALYNAAGSTVPIRDNGVSARPVAIHEGDYVLFGHYRGEPILWQAIAEEEGGLLLFSDAVLCLKAFAAAAEPVKASSDWRTSALRQWLNSPLARVPWTGTPPSAAYVYGGYNGYAEEPGFLAAENFEAWEIELMEHPPEKSGKDTVFLLTGKQLRRLSAAQRKKSPTRAALRQDNSPYLFVRPQCWYWTADSIATNGQSVRSVTTRGSFYQSLASDGLNGVCPALYLAEKTVCSAGGDGGRSAPYQIVRGARP